MEDGKVVTFTGYAVKFCSDKQCSHRDSERCVNAKSSKYYIAENTAKRLAQNIVSGTPVVLHHEAKCQLGEVIEAWVTNSGMVVRGYINDSEMLTSLRAQVYKYKDRYCKKISYEDYLQNIFSSISLSHDPKTLHVNHVGLVNIPGRTGTEVKYETSQDIPIKRYPNSGVNVRDSISAHLVAFLRNSNRVEKLTRNGRNSYANRSPKYLQASEKPYSSSSSFSKSSGRRNRRMPSGKDIVYSLASQLIDMANKQKRDDAIIPSLFPNLSDHYQQSPPPPASTPSLKRRKDDSGEGEDDIKKPRTENAIVSNEDVLKTFQSEMGNMRSKLLELEESRTKDMNALTDIFKNAATHSLPPPIVSTPNIPAILETETTEPISIEASTGLNRSEVDLDQMRRKELHSYLLETLRTALVKPSDAR